MPTPQLRKTALCTNFQNTGNCPFGEKCAFAHGESELRPSAPYAPRPPFRGPPRGMAPSPNAFRPPYPPPQPYAQPYGYYPPYPPAGPPGYGYYPPGPNPYAYPPAAPLPPTPYKGHRPDLYKTTLCKNFRDTGVCQFGETCSFAHGEHELKPFDPMSRPPPTQDWGAPQPGSRKRPAPFEDFGYNPADPSKKRKKMRPELRKTMLCSHYMSNGTCPFGESCNFAHGEQERRNFEPAYGSGPLEPTLMPAPI